MIDNSESMAESTSSDDLVQTREERISQRAYELFQARGQQEGHDLEDWLQAEAEIEADGTSGEETGIPSSAL